MNVILIGATGATGAALLQHLLQDEKITSVTALVRRPLDIRHDKLKTEVIDFDTTDWHPLVKGDAAFSCMGTTLKAAGSKEAQYKVDYTYQYTFANAAKQNGIPTFLLISAGMASPTSNLFYSRIKGELEEAIKALAFDRLVIFRPGLLSRPGTDRTGEKISEAILKFFNRIGLFRKFAPLPVSQLAQLMLHYAKQGSSGLKILESGKIVKEVADHAQKT